MEHPITPPPELVEEWFMEQRGLSEASRQHITTAAARWGADQELDACCEWLPKYCPWDADQLRAARRPKPPEPPTDQELVAFLYLIDPEDELSPLAMVRAALKRWGNNAI